MGTSDQQKEESSVVTSIVYPNIETDLGSQAYQPATYTSQSDRGSSSSSDHTAGMANPYITTSAAGQSPANAITDNLSRWRKKVEEVGKKAEEAAGNVWHHLKTGPNVVETAWGRLSQGTRLLAEGSVDKIFRQTFETAPDEQLQKSYACYLSASSGPVAGTLYISTKRVAFCSDRPLSYESSPGQRSWSYYKVDVPLDRLQATNPSSNPDNPSEKYIQLQTVDGHEFWFMGFVNYDKALSSLHGTIARES